MIRWEKNGFAGAGERVYQSSVGQWFTIRMRFEKKQVTTRRDSLKRGPLGHMAYGSRSCKKKENNREGKNLCVGAVEFGILWVKRLASRDSMFQQVAITSSWVSLYIQLIQGEKARMFAFLVVIYSHERSQVFVR